MDSLPKKLYSQAASEDKLNKILLNKYAFDYNFVPLAKGAGFVSGLCLVDKVFNIQFNMSVCPFLSAAYTLPEQRKRGLFAQVVQKAIARVYIQKMPFCIVNAEYAKVFEKFGFQTFSYNKKIAIDRSNSEYQYERITSRNIADVFEVYMLYVSRFNFYVRRNLRDFKELYKIYSKLGKDAYLIKKNGINIGYYFHCENGISEMVMLSKRFMEVATVNKDANIYVPCDREDENAEPYSMIRICNIERFLSLFRPKGDKCIRIRIKDNLIKENNGIFKIEISQGIVKVSKAKKADCEMTITELAKTVLGEPTEKDYLNGWFEKNRPLIFDKL